MAHGATAKDGATFQLERFEWASPDRLEVTGAFAGVDAPRGTPVLILRGPGGVHRLSGAADAEPVDGGPWSAAFVWEQPPAPFEAAELELGGFTVPLPAPGEKADALSVHGPAIPAAETLRLQAEIVAAQEEVRAARAAHERAVEELVRAQADFESERSRRVDDAERFKHALAQVRDAGEQALASTHADVTAMRERVAGLERELGEVQAMRVELAQARTQAEKADALEARLEAVRQALDEA
jgi:hypothetical protein